MPNNGVKSECGHIAGTGNGLPNNASTPPMCLRCGKNNHKKSYCKECKVSCRHCKSQKHTSHCCAFIPRASSTTNGVTSDTASTSGTSSDGQSQQTHLPNSPQKQKKKKSKNQDRQKQEHTQQPQAQQQDTGATPGR